MKRFAAVLALTTLLPACGSGDASPTGPGDGAPSDASAAAGSPAWTPTATATPTATPRPGSTSANFPEWTKTDFRKKTIDLTEVQYGCPARDCIPPLDADGATSLPGVRTGSARFVSIAESTYPENWPVAYVVVEGKARAYPLEVLTWHEIVNDRIGETPFAATFCPLCSTAIAFDRRVDGRVLDFGVSGLLRNSDLVMWDRQTESWWQQATGEAIVGDLAGKQLKPIAMPIVSWGEFRASFPAGDVLSWRTGLNREYGTNPYGGYDALTSSPFLFDGTLDRRLPALERVIGLGEGESEQLAVPFGALTKSPVANVTVAGRPMAVFWRAGTASPLDHEDIRLGRDIGSAVAFHADLDGRRLTFRLEGGRFVDQDGTAWSLTGSATDGPGKGRQLEVARHTTVFWFAWAAFHPKTAIWSP